ncbi:MAG: hypothetical protein GY953_53605, partial [bacterium]|nr:hypothetical protein [bacterium]
QPERELPGGVRAGDLLDTRSDYSERGVREQAQSHGRLSQMVAGLVQVESAFDIAAESGVAGSINHFYSALSQLALTPNDGAARENLISSAQGLARSFQFTSTSLAQARQHVGREAQVVVDKINSIGEDIRQLNEEIRSDYRMQQDAGVNARLYAALEELSSLVDFNAIHQRDGSTTVMVGGQVPLVIGDKVFEISADTAGNVLEIRDYEGSAVAATINEGQLGGLIELANNNIPSYATELDRLAQTMADRVNTMLAGGLDLNDQPPAVDLFT